MTIERERLQVLAVRTSHGCPDSKDQLARELIPFVEKLSGGFVIPGNDKSENLSVALVGLTEALNDYEPDRGEIVPFVSRVVQNCLIKEKNRRLAKHADTDTDYVEKEASPDESQKADREAIRRAWPFLTHAEKRGVMTVIGQSQFVKVGENEGVTKQAVEKAWRSARSVIHSIQDGKPVMRKSQQYSRFDLYLDELLESVG